MEIRHKVYLGLGSNLGNSKQRLLDAIQLISEEIGVVTKKSSFYTTAALNPADQPEMVQPDYVNMVVLCESRLSPSDISKTVHAIEDKLGLNREKKVFWGPREIDIDILAIDDLLISEPGLKVPHPGIESRDFVLCPLAEITPEFIHPLSKTGVSDLINQLKERFIKSVDLV